MRLRILSDHKASLTLTFYFFCGLLNYISQTDLFALFEYVQEVSPLWLLDLVLVTLRHGIESFVRKI